MKQDRFLAGILVFIALLVVGALVIFFTGRVPQEYRTGSTPEDVVYNFALALTRSDYTRAYQYVADEDGKPSLAEFQAGILRNEPVDRIGLRITTANVLETEAVVNVSLVYGGRGPLDSGYTIEDVARLVLQQGEWKVVQMPYPFWSFDWYQEGLRP